MKAKRFNVLSLTQIAICASVLCVSAYIVIPLPLVPITLQLFAVVLIALLLKPADTLICLLIYLLLGVVGLPVFSGGKGGLGALLSPTGGFIIGFLIGAFLISLFKGKNGSLVRYIIVSLICGVVPIYIFGFGFYMLFTSSDLISTITSLGSVFIMIDIAKCIFASLLAIILRKALLKSNIGFEL